MHEQLRRAASDYATECLARQQEADRIATWTEGVIARYLTVAGATVDIDDQDCCRCSGCGAGDGDDRFVSTVNSEDRARRWAQSHAEKCRALAKPATDA